MISQIDIAPTIAKVLSLRLLCSDGKPIADLERWQCRNAILIIVDSLGYDLYRYLKGGLKAIEEIAAGGVLLQAKAVSGHTSPAIASILSGLLPEHHGITDTKSAKESGILSIPDIATMAGLSCAVVMEKGGAEVYEGLVDFIGPVPRTLQPMQFDREICRLSLKALECKPRLLVSYFIGLDKAAHNGLNIQGFREAAGEIDDHIGEIARAASPGTMIIIAGDHPVHAGVLRRETSQPSVAVVAGRIKCK